MISDYIKCPKLLSASECLPQTDINTYLEYLEAKHYSKRTINSYIGCVIHYFSWQRNVNKDHWLEVDNSKIGEFISLHLNNCKCPPSFHRGRNSCRASLRLWCRLIVEVAYPPTLSPEDELFKKYDAYLASVSGLVKVTRIARCRYGRELLNWLNRACARNVTELTQQDVATYVYQRSVKLTPGTITAMVSALGCFVSYLSSTGQCSIPLPIYIPRPKPIYEIPAYQALTTQEIKSILQSFDLNTSVGKRDYCLARCMTELGLRTDDAARISLDNIDWRHQVLTLDPGKNHRQHRLPIPDLLLEAMVDYVQNGRPSTTDRALFVYHRAPLGQAVTVATVRGVIRRAFVRAGIAGDRHQVHRFRHTMATRLLSSGQTIKSIADVLGHQSYEASNRYTHVDIDNLSDVAMPWPQGDEI
ncbi:tyrosine-type recombinase/integrase [Vibrio sp. 1180_3]|uniref:tyrosine-type recombinase/integrase n=1 Tax=Vibrio sp. 1180_3 TaxID=2528832 RepID=UPI0024052173|nr:tyrosine-type recombinase/integrase [Vibrio sp. 1180_3]